MGEATEFKEDLTLILEKIKEIRFLLHHGTHSPKTDEQNPRLAELRDKLSLCKAVGLDLDQTKEQILFGILSYESSSYTTRVLGQDSCTDILPTCGLSSVLS
ncbi:uncharacterized protein LOC112494130 [Cephus cinctus]|uniref:Uncharacterized protein LOC112494130 n=1 Tax=Cephus cinctus TaxID=211228 RepID=A0AAJ7RF45_CEPCN|nr:uncharacterized protein LOC112494130 [Cephus cinctus]